MGKKDKTRARPRVGKKSRAKNLDKDWSGLVRSAKTYVMPYSGLKTRPEIKSSKIAPKTVIRLD